MAINYTVDLAGDSLIKECQEAIIGMCTRDEKEITVAYPEDFPEKEMAGTTKTFRVTVKEVKERHVPELDDEFAKDMADVQSLAELRDRIRGDLVEERERTAEATLRSSVMESLIARTSFEVPPGIVERQLQHQISSFQREYGQHVPEDVMRSQIGRMAEEGRPAAERRVREAFLLEAVAKARGVEVKYAIHPVAGRMPGHMNVLLAEANVPYPELYEIEDINPELPNTDVAVVVGANDVVNPAARDDPDSPIAGMPIVEVDRARHCVILKRSLSPGFAGIDNELFYLPNTRMFFGSAEKSLADLVHEVKAL